MSKKLPAFISIETDIKSIARMLAPTGELSLKLEDPETTCQIEHSVIYSINRTVDAFDVIGLPKEKQVINKLIISDDGDSSIVRLAKCKYSKNKTHIALLGGKNKIDQLMNISKIDNCDDFRALPTLFNTELHNSYLNYDYEKLNSFIRHCLEKYGNKFILKPQNGANSRDQIVFEFPYNAVGNISRFCYFITSLNEIAKLKKKVVRNRLIHGDFYKDFFRDFNIHSTEVKDSITFDQLRNLSTGYLLQPYLETVAAEYRAFVLEDSVEFQYRPDKHTTDSSRTRELALTPDLDVSNTIYSDLLQRKVAPILKEFIGVGYAVDVYIKKDNTWGIFEYSLNYWQKSASHLGQRAMRDLIKAKICEMLKVVYNS